VVAVVGKHVWTVCFEGVGWGCLLCLFWGAFLVWGGNLKWGLFVWTGAERVRSGGVVGVKVWSGTKK